MYLLGRAWAMGLVDVALGVRPQLFGLAVAPVLLVTPLEPGCQIFAKFWRACY